MKKHLLCFLIIACPFSIINCFSQGTWTALAHNSPDANGGVMLLLSDGTVMAKTVYATGDTTQFGVVWDKLTPDIHGSYVNGTWSHLASMHNSRLYFASQVLRDGNVFVAGGEYGTGDSLAEVYNTLTNSWTMAPPTIPYIGDANSEILPDGRVLLSVFIQDNSTIFNPSTNTWSAGAATHGYLDESAWVKLPDNSILAVDMGSTSSERYIPATIHWVVDGIVPDSLYDSWGYESGAGFMLPDGRAFFLGSTGHTAYYTPTGNTSPGTWAVGPDIPNGYGTPDAAAAMMVNGKILCAVSPAPRDSNVFYSPTAFFEFDYLTNSFTQVSAPGVTGDTLSEACYVTNMLDLPNGTVLFSNQYSNQYFIYTPSGSQLASGMPTINNVTRKA